MYGVNLQVPQPIDTYDSMHAELKRLDRLPEQGLLVHFARPIPEGFEVIELWESEDDYQRYQRDVIDPLYSQMAPNAAPREADGRSFEVRGLVIPGAHIQY